MLQKAEEKLTPWEHIGGVLAVLAVVLAGLMVVTMNPHGPVPSEAAIVAPQERERPTAAPITPPDADEGGAHDATPRRPDATHGITAPNARQWLSQRSKESATAATLLSEVADDD